MSRFDELNGLADFMEMGDSLVGCKVVMAGGSVDELSFVWSVVSSVVGCKVVVTGVS